MEYYPPWLGDSVVKDSFPWQHAIRTTFPDFLTAYTLHDSYWLGWYGRPNRDAIAIFRWDTWFMSDRVPYPSDDVSLWPLLLVRMERLYQLHMNYGVGEGYDTELVETISGAASVTILDAEREAMLESVLNQPSRPDALSTYLLETPLYRTVVQSIGDGQVQAIHGGATDVLCLNCEGEIIPIPGLGAPREESGGGRPSMDEEKASADVGRSK